MVLHLEQSNPLVGWFDLQWCCPHSPQNWNRLSLHRRRLQPVRRTPYRSCRFRRFAGVSVEEGEKEQSRLSSLPQVRDVAHRRSWLRSLARCPLKPIACDPWKGDPRNRSPPSRQRTRCPRDGWLASWSGELGRQVAVQSRPGRRLCRGRRRLCRGRRVVAGVGVSKWLRSRDCRVRRRWRGGVLPSPVARCRNLTSTVRMRL